MNSQPPRLDRSEIAAGYRLRVLGRLSLDGAPGQPDGAATRPRSLALLAVLAAAGAPGVPRDRLLLYLWPESNTKRARNSLHQTLYAIRRHVGQDAVLVEASNLRLNAAVITCDLHDFDAALERGATEEAIASYGGFFLDGFALADLPEFEHWVEEQRARLTRRYSEALETSAAAAAKGGRYRLAVERWKALSRLDPLSARSASGLIQAFVAAGNRASALEYAREYEALIRRELGTEPDPSVLALVREIRTRRSQEDVAAPPSAPVAADPPTRVPASELEIGSGAPRVHFGLAALPLVLVIAAILAAWNWIGARPARSPISPGLVAVLPFSVAGNPALQYLDTGLVDLLSTKLEGAGEIRSVDPRALVGWISQRGSPVRTPGEAAQAAARFGAQHYLLGTVVENGGRIQLRAALYDRQRAGAPVVTAAVQGGAAEIFGMVDRLAGEILAGSSVPVDRLARVAARTTSSLEALKGYLAGDRELREGRYVPALELFQRALSADSGFALAHYRLSLAAEWAGRHRLARDAAQAAVRMSAGLADHDRMLIRALGARRDGNNAEAERLYRLVVADYPDDVEAWFQLGDVLFHANPLRGRASTEARDPFEQVLRLDPDNEEALVHLARIAFIEGRRADADSLARRVLSVASSGEVLELRAFRAFALGDRDANKRVTRELLERPPQVPGVSALQVAVQLDDLDGVERFAGLLRRESHSEEIRGLGYRLLARVAAARGRWPAARAQLDTARRFDATSALELRSLLAVLPFLDVPRADLLAVQGELEGWRPMVETTDEAAHSSAHAGLHPYVRLYRLGLVCAELGDSVAAKRHADALDRSIRRVDPLTAEALRAFSRSIRSRVALAAGKPTEALALLDQANWELVEPAFESEALHRYHRAELLHALGRDREALDWYRTIAQRATYELVYVAPARLREAEIHAEMGNRALAARAYDAAALLWKDAEPGPRKALIDWAVTR